MGIFSPLPFFSSGDKNSLGHCSKLRHYCVEQASASGREERDKVASQKKDEPESKSGSWVLKGLTQLLYF